MLPARGGTRPSAERACAHLPLVRSPAESRTSFCLFRGHQAHSKEVVESSNAELLIWRDPDRIPWHFATCRSYCFRIRRRSGRRRLPKMPTTARLRLRSWRDEDLEPFVALNADPRVREFFPSLQTRQESAESMQYIRDHFRHRGFGLWAVEVIGGAPFIGFIGLSVPSFDAPFMPCVELGYRLAFDHWGRGYATEGARAAIAFGFATVGLFEIVAMTAVGNERSRRVMARVGMTRNVTDDFDHPNIVAGHPLRRHVLYRLTAGDWVLPTLTGAPFR
jgi:RimJ/RimL family protein N-acetyltransferase